MDRLRDSNDGSRGIQKEKGVSARKSALNDDQRMWEENRLLTSGAGECVCVRERVYPP